MLKGKKFDAFALPQEGGAASRQSGQGEPPFPRGQGRLRQQRPAERLRD